MDETDDPCHARPKTSNLIHAGSEASREGAVTMRIAVSQFEPGTDPAANADYLVRAAARAAADGAALLLAPEGSIVSFLTDPDAPRRAAQPLDGPFVSALAAASLEHGITIAAGTFVPDPDSDRVHNT